MPWKITSPIKLKAGRRWTWFAVAVVLGGGGVGALNVIASFLQFKDAVQTWFASSVASHPWFWFLAVCALAYVALVSAMYSAFGPPTNASLDMLVRLYMDTARKLSSDSLSGTGPRHTIKRLKRTYLVRRDDGGDWSGTVTTHIEITTSDSTLQLYPIQIAVSSGARPVQLLADLSLSITDQRLYEVPYFPIELEDRRKRLLLVFAPPIRPADSPRVITVTYNWRGMWNELKSQGREILEWPFESALGGGELEFEVLWDQGLGRSLALIPTAVTGGDTEAVETVSNGNKGRKYIIRSSPSGKTTFYARLEVVDFGSG